MHPIFKVGGHDYYYFLKEIYYWFFPLVILSSNSHIGSYKFNHEYARIERGGPIEKKIIILANTLDT